MSIEFNEHDRSFHLRAGKTSYIFKIHPAGYPVHVYWGPALRGFDCSRMPLLAERPSFSPRPDPADGKLSLDTLPQEYPSFGTSDFRNPAIQIRFADGSTIAEPVYAGHRILPGKPSIPGLPSTYAEEGDEVETLELELRDSLRGLSILLHYSVFPRHDAIARSATIRDTGTESMEILRAMSASVDFPDRDFEFLQLPGAWARERQLERSGLPAGMVSIGSRRGSSSHQHNPFFALARPGAGEDSGEVFAFSLVYSGNFSAEAEVDQFGATRATMGINPFGFSWRLSPGESFETPETVLVHSREGLGGMSRSFHRLYRERLCRGAFRDAPRPILVNNWEATYFDFDAAKLLSIADEAAKLGMDLFVLDDGWFGRRDSDTSSLGDWTVHARKLPSGLPALAEALRDRGLGFGLWFEPEMVSPDSELYRAHPDWCLHVPGYRRTEARKQLVLDFSREDVREAILAMLMKILSSTAISYVKWDMNRNMTEVRSAGLAPERQGETAHRYMLGLYAVLERITSAFPRILFESCSGGGGRFDPGMLHYMPQTWTSDDSDAAERLKIQCGTSMVYPASTMAAHVSAVPNHQVGRITSLEARGFVAMAGTFGYELDLTKLGEEERRTVSWQIAFYRRYRDLVMSGDLYRLKSPFEGNESAWMYVSPDKKRALLTHVWILGVPNPPLSMLRLRGLDPGLDYSVEEMRVPSQESDSGQPQSPAPAVLMSCATLLGGDLLMHRGLDILPPLRDFLASAWTLQAGA
jgi:alpha-galactosidase